MNRPTVVVAGLGDTGVMVATRLARTCRVIAVATRPALVSGQELGMRLADPDQWQRHYFVPLSRFRKLDDVDVRHGRVVSADLDTSTVTVESIDGTTSTLRYDVFVVATGVSNGFWRDDRVEDVDAVRVRIVDSAQRLADARTVAVIGGGATAVSVADNVARRSDTNVHLFTPGDELLHQHHPRARRWIMKRLQRDGVTVHTGYRAVLPDGTAPDRITGGPVQWSTGQRPFDADAVVWAVGAVRPHTNFLPRRILDDEGFVVVDDRLQVVGCRNVFAVGDVAATDPLRGSARNWGHRVLVTNVRSFVRGSAPRRRFRAPRYRWGSIIGLQSDGLTVASASGTRFRVPRRLAEPMLYGAFVTRGLYGGLRRADDRTR